MFFPAGVHGLRLANPEASLDRQLEQGEAVSGVEYADARIRREKLCGHIKAMFADNDIDVIRTTIWILGRP